MTTIIVQADLMHESGWPESVPVEIEVNPTARIGFGVKDAGLVVEVKYGSALPGGEKQVQWRGKETFQGSYSGVMSRGPVIEGYSVLIPTSEMLSGDKVVSVTTSNGGSWVLSGEKYNSVSGGSDGFAFPEVSVSDGFGNTNSEREDELSGGYRLG